MNQVNRFLHKNPIVNQGSSIAFGASVHSMSQCASSAFGNIYVDDKVDNSFLLVVGKYFGMGKYSTRPPS